MKSRNTPLINTLTLNNAEENKEEIYRDLNTRTNKHNLRTKDTILIPSSNHGPSAIAETEMRVSLERDLNNQFSSRNNLATTIGNDTPSISNRIMMLENSVRNQIGSRKRNMRNAEFISALERPSSSILKKAWEEESVRKEPKDDRKYDKAQKFSTNFIYSAKISKSAKPNNNIKLPKIEENIATRNIYINDEDEKEEIENENEEEKKETLIKIEFPELNVEESKDMMISDHFNHIVPFSPEGPGSKLK